MSQQELEECIPKNTFIELIDRAFNERTDVPRILAFWAALHYLSAFLLQSDIKINIKGLTLLPDFWSIALAPSGAGKTFTQNTIAKSLAGDLTPTSPFREGWCQEACSML